MKHFKSILNLVIVIFVTLTYSCKKDALLPSEVSNSSSKQEIVTMSFNDFLTETQDSKYTTTRSFLTATINYKQKYSTKGVDPNSRLELYTDSIRKIQKDGHSTYTFSVVLPSPRSAIFQNFIVDEFGGEVKTFLVTYYPSKKYQELYRQGKKPFFTGKVKVELYEISKTDLTGKINKTSQLSQICQTLRVYTGCENHWCSSGEHVQGGTPEQDPARCVATVKPWTEYFYQTSTNCWVVDIPGPGGGGSSSGGSEGGGGSGGGGSTPPTPPPGYDPCNEQPIVTAGVPTIAGTPCDNPGDPGVPPTVDPDPYEIRYQGLADFPCIMAAIQNLENNSAYQSWVQPFKSTTYKPDLVWTHNDNLAWKEPTSGGIFTQYGANVTSLPVGNGFYSNTSSTAQLNSDMLRNSSKRLILTVAVHETLHAFFNYVSQYYANYQEVADDNKPLLERLSAYAKTSTDQNGPHHLTMLRDYITTIAGIVKDADAQKMSDEYYMKLAIGGALEAGKIPSQTFETEISTLLDGINTQFNFNITRANAVAAMDAESSVSSSNRLHNNCLP